MADSEPSRYERKFLISAVPQAWVEQVVRLHPAQFRELHPRRFVNNCYFDSPRLASYRDSVEGHPRREKVRIRWYGDLFGPIPEPMLEIKAKAGLVGGKTKLSLPPLYLDRTSDIGTLGQWLGAAEHTVPPQFAALRPTLINRYARRYLISADRRFRITLDSELEYHRVAAPRLRADPTLGDALTTILEIKYGEGADDAVSFITDRLPFRLTKSSKYTMGLRRLGLR